MKERFSKRIGLQPVAAEITIRCDAPEDFRRYLSFVMQNLGLGLKKIREIVCIATKKAALECVCRKVSGDEKDTLGDG